MTAFEQQFFKEEKFSKEQIQLYFKSARHALDIAAKDTFPEVQFDYAYKALIKIGIALIAAKGYRVRGVPGHHVKTIQKLGEILKDEEVFEVGNAMRMKRNKDLYDADATITDKDAAEYIVFVNDVIKKAKMILK